MNEHNMILRPVDFSLLNELTDGRNVAGNLHLILDSARPYINQRLTVLHDYGLVRRIGPNENVGLYEITDSGRRALEHKALYKDDQDRFEDIVENDAPADDA